MADNKSFKTKFKDAFDFTASEIRGMILLVLIICFFLFFLIVIQYYINKKTINFTQKDDVLYEQFVNEQIRLRDSINDARKNKYKQKKNFYSKTTLCPFHFCVDTMKINDWKRLGFTEKEAIQIDKYLAKGGKIKKSEDLKKLYCIDEKEYNILKDYVHFKNEKKQFSKIINDSNSIINKKEKVKKINRINLNKADSIELETIQTISTKMVSNILRYRKRLGGFYSLEQLQEVYGIDNSNYSNIVNYFYIDSQYIKTININKATIKELTKHPYIEYPIAKLIVSYREKNGPYQKVEEIKKAAIIYDELYKKIIPYLSIN